MKHKKQQGFLFIDDSGLIVGFISLLLLGMAAGAFIIRWKYGLWN